jgi:hypothetical protein
LIRAKSGPLGLDFGVGHSRRSTLVEERGLSRWSSTTTALRLSERRLPCPVPFFQSRAFGVGHKPESVAAVRRAEVARA